MAWVATGDQTISSTPYQPFNDPLPHLGTLPGATPRGCGCSQACPSLCAPLPATLSMHPGPSLGCPVARANKPPQRPLCMAHLVLASGITPSLTASPSVPLYVKKCVSRYAFFDTLGMHQWWPKCHDMVPFLAPIPCECLPVWGQFPHSSTLRYPTTVGLPE